MTTYYSGRSVYRYFSKIDEAVSFETAVQAALQDRELAIQIVTSTSAEGFDAALRFGGKRLVAALRLLAEEIDDVVMPAEKA
jgi:hypothetical protein